MRSVFKSKLWRKHVGVVTLVAVSIAIMRGAASFLNTPEGSPGGAMALVGCAVMMIVLFVDCAALMGTLWTSYLLFRILLAIDDNPSASIWARTWTVFVSVFALLATVVMCYDVFIVEGWVPGFLWLQAYAVGIVLITITAWCASRCYHLPEHGAVRC